MLTPAAFGASPMGRGMRGDIDQVAVKKAYARWAPFYDFVFGALFDSGRQAALAAAEKAGEQILEVGVGTGISLPDYSSANRITGVDLSESMLRKARERVSELALKNVVRLEVMDAEHLSFPDDSFDAVVALYVVSTVPHPQAALDEFARVVKPGGEIILANRVGADGGLRRGVEEMLQPISCRLGWRLDFPWDHFAQWTQGRDDIYLIERRPLAPFGHFSLLRFGKSAPKPRS
jgi:phosphatidylethanolamine/phosphatidyl-N-methylethanolamine N-methyltransferase